MRLILVGAPGAGKGTQARMLGEQLQVPHISTGDLLRSAIQRGTPVGLQAKAYMEAGELVPDPIMIQVLEERLREPDCANGFILDGFPRTLSQASYLNTLLERLQTPIEAVVSIEVERDVIIERLSHRLICPSCHRNYNEKTDQPRVQGVCNVCGSSLTHRLDDDAVTVMHRLDVYLREIAPLKEFYRVDGLLRSIDGNASPRVVEDRILANLPGGASGAASWRG